MPPIRPLETLHNALSLRKLDSFLQDMILAQIFKTPTGSPPRVIEGTVVSNSASILATGVGQPVSVSIPSDSMAAFSSMIDQKDSDLSTQKLVRGTIAPFTDKCDRSVIISESDSTMEPHQPNSPARSEEQVQSSEFEDANDAAMKNILTAQKQRKFSKRKSRIGWRT